MLRNVNTISWCCCNIAVDESEVDYWKSEVITFVVEFQGEGQGKKQTFSSLNSYSQNYLSQFIYKMFLQRRTIGTLRQRNEKLNDIL